MLLSDLLRSLGPGEYVIMKNTPNTGILELAWRNNAQTYEILFFIYLF